MTPLDTIHENPRVLPDYPYTQVWGWVSNTAEIVTLLSSNLESIGIWTFEFEDFLISHFNNQQVDDGEIIAFRVQNNSIKVFFSTGQSIDVAIDLYTQYQISEVLGTETVEQIEAKVENLNAAIESIFDANDWYFWDGEINDEDVIEDDSFWSELRWKTLNQLRELLELENQKLYQVYTISWESDKKEALLMLELQFFVWIWDRYEWGARYFALTTQEISDKVRNLISHMTNDEVYAFITQTNESIETNTKKSDMVNQLNLKLINELYTQVFDRLLETEASDRDFIWFAKVVTGRGRLIRENDGDYEYDDLEIDSAYKAIDLANRAMVHVMYRENGILDNIQWDMNSISIEDDELDWMSPSAAIQFSIWELEEFAWYNDMTWVEMVNELGFWDLLWIDTPYEELSFQEKVELWWLVRIAKAVRDISREDLEEDPNIINNQLTELVSESFENLNASLSDNFNASWTDWNGTSADDLWLHWDLAEMFNLYQEINGNYWALRFSDASRDSYTPTLRWALILWLGMLSAWICMWMLTAGAPIIAIIAAWAAAWAMTGLISQLIGRQWYDTSSEAIVDTLAVMWTDAIVWALFFLLSVAFFRRFFNIEILGEAFFTRVNFADMLAFGWAETLAWSMITTPYVSAFVKRFFPDNHFSTDVRALTEQLEQLGLQQEQ